MPTSASAAFRSLGGSPREALHPPLRSVLSSLHWTRGGLVGPTSRSRTPTRRRPGVRREWMWTTGDVARHARPEGQDMAPLRCPPQPMVPGVSCKRCNQQLILRPPKCGNRFCTLKQCVVWVHPLPCEGELIAFKDAR